MTDKLLSAEKVKAWIESEIRDLSGFDEADTGPIAHNIQNELEHLEKAIHSGQLDADRPECPKCNDTGTEEIRRRGGITEQWPCDCKASK